MKAEYRGIMRSELIRVVREVSRIAKLREGALLGRLSRGPIARWRWIAMALFRRAGHSYPQIGAAFNRDHTTVMNGVSQAEGAFSATIDRVAALVRVESVHSVRFGPRPPQGPVNPADAARGEVEAEAEVERLLLAEEREGKRPFDVAVARLDRALSEIMLQAKQPQDEADSATLRHHAGDLILSGVAILRRLGRLADLEEYLPKEGGSASD